MVEHIKFGSTIHIAHGATRKYLIDVNRNYPPPGSISQHMVVASQGASDSSGWEIRPAYENRSTAIPDGPIENGSIIRLMHSRTKWYLHSHPHGHKIPVQEPVQEVTTYKNENDGDANDNWQIQIDGGGPWTTKSIVQFIHVTTSSKNAPKFLYSRSELVHSTYTSGEQGVFCLFAPDGNEKWTTWMYGPPSLSSISVSGFRSFKSMKSLSLGTPKFDQPGSGMTILVGPNNGGKSTLLEAIELVMRGEDQNVERHHRHRESSYSVEISASWSDDAGVGLKSDVQNPGELKVKKTPAILTSRRALFVPNVRNVSKTIDRNLQPRELFITQQAPAYQRSPANDRLSKRMQKWLQPNERFRALLEEVLDFELRQHTDGPQPYVEINQIEHRPEGLGSGIISLLWVIDALHDAEDGATIIIDEPELSLHPYYQRKLATLLQRESTRLQIIFATNSPFMIQWSAINGGATLARVYRDGHGDGFSDIAALKSETVASLQGISSDLNNPHTLGTNATEVFFLPDRIILVEGQEDVVCLGGIAEQLQTKINGNIYGWGVGGATKMGQIAQLLADLGYQKVAGLLDADKSKVADQLNQQFPNFKFIVSTADDIRDKRQNQTKPKDGLCASNGKLHDNRRTEAEELLKKLNASLV